MANFSSGDNLGKPMEQPENDLSGAMENLSVTPVDSDKTAQPKNLSDMPFDVVGLLIERSDYKEQLILCKTSKSLRSLVDKLKPSCDSVRVFFYYGYILAYFNNYPVIYTSPESVNKDPKAYNNWMKNSSAAILVRDDYEKIAIDDLVSTLKNPKLQLEQLYFDFPCGRKTEKMTEEFYSKMENVFKSLNHQLSVRKLSNCQLCPSNLLTALPYLKPGVLKELEIDGRSSTENHSLDIESISLEIQKMFALNQWKQAEKLDLVSCLKMIPVEHLVNFKQLQIWEDSLSDQLLISLRNCFSESKNCEHCSIHINSEQDFELLPAIVGTPVDNENEAEYTAHYQISDSDHYLEFKFLQQPGMITIEKKKGS